MHDSRKARPAYDENTMTPPLIASAQWYWSASRNMHPRLRRVLQLHGAAAAHVLGLTLPSDELGYGFGRYRYADQETLNLGATLRA